MILLVSRLKTRMVELGGSNPPLPIKSGNSQPKTPCRKMQKNSNDGNEKVI